MAFRTISLVKMIRRTSVLTRSITKIANTEFQNKQREFKDENNLVFLQDPDTFGTLSRKLINQDIPEDEDDVKEENFIKNQPLKSKKLTTKQYADLIKQNLHHKRLKEAIDILEVRMLEEDRVKPENYIYNILIGACADVGYTKKAFKLFNDMKRRALKPSGDTYTCLFTACANSPWPQDGLKNANHLRNLMLEKQIEPNLTNYNAMIKAFGRCGDITTSFQIVDEMKAKKIKIRVHTLNHLLQACISDKEHGLRHALLVWRKMLQLRERPNIYSFNLMLKCVKECSLGTKDDIKELVQTIQMSIPPKVPKNYKELEANPSYSVSQKKLKENQKGVEESTCLLEANTESNATSDCFDNSLLPVLNEDRIKLEFLDNKNKLAPVKEKRLVPNLLTMNPNMEHVLGLKEAKTIQDKLAIIGGQDDFLREMEEYSVQPDIKTFTQLLMVAGDSTEAELKILEKMKQLKIFADIDFYNMLMKKRCLRSDYNTALEVKKLIEDENIYRKKKHPMKKKLILKYNVMTYGILALACKTKENAVNLLQEMKEKKIKVNIEILGALLRHGTAQSHFGYVRLIMNIVKEEQLKINGTFIRHLELFNDKCTDIVKKGKTTEKFTDSYRCFQEYYKQWLRDVNAEEAIKSEHPWAQFKYTQPETVQRQNINIEEPKKFYKRYRGYQPYTVKF